MTFLYIFGLIYVIACITAALRFSRRQKRDYGVRPSINSEVHCDRSLK